LTEYPELMEVAKDAFPSDVIERAKELLEEVGSVGAYSHSQGVPFIRKSVAKFIEGMPPFPPLLLARYSGAKLPRLITVESF
jgi:alanine transaminase